MNKKAFIWILCAVILGGLLWLKAQTVSNPSWEQPTMGTTCRITLSGSIPKSGLAVLREKIDDALLDVNERMSVWDPDTEISKFNALNSTEPFPISPEFAEVVQSALAFSEMTDGAFDPTVKPLVDHWGFGPAAERQISNNEGDPIVGHASRIRERVVDTGSLHTETQSGAFGMKVMTAGNGNPVLHDMGTTTSLEKIMESVGWKKLKLEDGVLIKTHPQLQLDLAAIAKGYGVDRVAAVIRESGRTSFLVEIGGEIVAAGINPSEKPWRVGIESPEPDKAFGEEIFQTVELSDKAIATSGNYRNFRLHDDGTRYSHIIDPHTGKPAASDVAAVTVIATRCMDADAVATALFVMGSKKGLAWVEANKDFEALFIIHAPDGSFTAKSSIGFQTTD